MKLVDTNKARCECEHHDFAIPVHTCKRWPFDHCRCTEPDMLRRVSNIMWTLRVLDQYGTVWDETEYGGNSTNKLEQLIPDLKYIIENPDAVNGRVVTLIYEDK